MFDLRGRVPRRSSFPIVVGEQLPGNGPVGQPLPFQRLDCASFFPLKMLPPLAFRQFCGIMLAVHSDCPPSINVVLQLHYIMRVYHYGSFSKVSNFILQSTMNIFLKQLSEKYRDDIILLCCDGAAWHKSAGLELPDNIVLFHIPPYTPEMNPIEHIWKEIRKRGFHNEVFPSLDKVVDRLCDTICSLSNDAISSITGRNWIIK